MIHVLRIDLDETMKREPVYRWGSSGPVGMTRGTVRRSVTVQMTIEDDADLDKIRNALAGLTRPEEAERGEAYGGPPMIGNGS